MLRLFLVRNVGRINDTIAHFWYSLVFWKRVSPWGYLLPITGALIIILWIDLITCSLLDGSECGLAKSTQIGKGLSSNHLQKQCTQIISTMSCQVRVRQVLPSYGHCMKMINFRGPSYLHWIQTQWIQAPLEWLILQAPCFSDRDDGSVLL